MVRDWFYPSYRAVDPFSAPPPEMRQTAVQHVRMWSFKDPKLPHAIIATANLTEAMLHDTLDRREAISDWALRSIYAMAFCRFVNGFVDRDIAKAALRATAATRADGAVLGPAGNDDEAGASTLNSRGESSMYAHATTIGMPEQFVELRHRATHEEMPSIEVLRQMARQGLEWLWERWWKVHATGHPGRALREREARRLLAERKANARRLNEAHKRHGADSADEAGSADEYVRVRHRGQKTGEAVEGVDGGDAVGSQNLDGKQKLDVYDGDDAIGWHGLDGKQKLDVYDEDLDTEMPEDRHNAERNEKLTKVKMKPWVQPAFGLFQL
jgi:hypothetical protein